MSRRPETIQKQRVLKPAEDFYRLRREGIGYIQRMAGSVWTDYNFHDPGITILDVLCYAITDLAYRTGWDIKDILSKPAPDDDPNPLSPNQPFPNQPFFTAKDILTVNPWTPDDFRRLLIDLGPVRNAWVVGKVCACDLHYYAWCEYDRLTLSFQKPADIVDFKKVEPLGLYEVLLELESDPALGDLNDRKIDYSDVIYEILPLGNGTDPHPVRMELRFPEWGLECRDSLESFLNLEDDFNIRVSKLGATKTYNVLEDSDTPEEDSDTLEKKKETPDDYLRRHWQRVFYVDFDITSKNDGQEKSITIRHAALRIFGDAFIKKKTTIADSNETIGLKSLLENNTPTGFIRRYRQKLLKVENAVAETKKALHHHRNLDEDYCRVRGVEVEDVAVCADVEVTPDADIEQVQARIWFEIEQYFNPPVRFYSLQELMESEVPVEDIFNGPILKNGFITAKDLEAAALKTVLRTSDIIDRLMDIEGILAVNNLVLSKYDAEGNVIKGAADPLLPGDSDSTSQNPVVDAERTAASWLLFVSPLHQPRLYHNQSRFLFFKNELPFIPRMDEAGDTLTQLRGEAERSKLNNTVNDLPVPTGRYRNPEDYFPVQYSFPMTYGIGPEGLPSHASAERRAQARQLKAYLMVFEQLLGNAFTQIACTADLFSIDPAIKHTYFVREFNDKIIQGYADVIDGLNLPKLQDMAETVPEFQERRNRFLNHIMARFGEQFSEYALLLTNLYGRKVAPYRLINDKLAFLNACPRIGRDRGRAFDYRRNPCLQGNIPGIRKRVSLLLGYPDLCFSWTVPDPVANRYEVAFQLKDSFETIWMEGHLTITSPAGGTTEDEIEERAFRELIRQMTRTDAYTIASENSKFRLRLKDGNGDPLGHHPKPFEKRAGAQAIKEELLGWSANERTMVVEHLLLRPKFPGDALYPVCTDGACETCGNEDPYSFRLTFVMPGWTAPFNTNLEMRAFAERTIRRETPAHLLGKICWVGNDDVIEDPENPVIDDPNAHDAMPDDRQFERFEDAWYKWLKANAAFDWTEERVQDRVEAILRNNVKTVDPAIPSSREELRWCAAAIVTGYGMAFHDWMDAHLKAGHTLDDMTDFSPESIDPDALCTGIEFNPGTGEDIQALLDHRYRDYTGVSYRLRIVVDLLSKLRNTYPSATLHDCDEGSDKNPVRLGKTALGKSQRY